MKKNILFDEYRFNEEGYPFLELIGQYLGMTGMSIENHLSPDISIPEQVDECIEGYKYIINKLKVDPKKVFISGSSAGASLVLLMIQKLNKLGLSQPCGAIIMSPVGDITFSMARKTIKQDGIKDSVLGDREIMYEDDLRALFIDRDDINEYNECKNRKEKEIFVSNGKYCCINGDFKGICPVYVWASQNEILINDAKLIIEKCKQVGVDVEYELHPYLIHAILAIFLKNIPEARDSVIIIIQWMKRQLEKQLN